MSQRIPDIAKAQQLAKVFLDTRMVELFTPQQAEHLVDMMTPVRQRENAPSQNLGEYFEDPTGYYQRYVEGETHLVEVTNVEVRAQTMRDQLADFWCHHSKLMLGNLDQIRTAYEKHPDEIATHESLYDHNPRSPKEILDLLLAIDTLAQKGETPNPSVIRTGLAALINLRKEQKGEGVSRVDRAHSAQQLEERHFSERAKGFLTDIILKQEDKIPFYIPETLRVRMRALVANGLSDRTERDAINEASTALVRQHESVMKAADFEQVAERNLDHARFIDVHVAFLDSIIDKLQEISRALAIQPERKRRKDG